MLEVGNVEIIMCEEAAELTEELKGDDLKEDDGKEENEEEKKDESEDENRDENDDGTDENWTSRGRRRHKSGTYANGEDFHPLD